MSITLKFFMIKRGLTVEKMAVKSNSKTPAELITYAKSLNIGVTAADEALINEYYASQPVEANEPPQPETAVITPDEGEKPVPDKKKRGKKNVGKDV